MTSEPTTGTLPDTTQDQPAGLRCDLAVVGGGPAGLAAASVALLGGLSVAVVDSGQELGGQFWRHPPHGSDADPGDDLHHDLSTYAQLTRSVREGARAGACALLLGHQVWTATRGDAAPDGAPAPVTLHLLDRSAGPGHERALRLVASRVILATGAYDRPLPFPGWDLPGVYTAGGLQALLKGGGVRAGSRVVVGGTGPFLLPVATGLTRTAPAWLGGLAAVSPLTPALQAARAVAGGGTGAVLWVLAVLAWGLVGLVAAVAAVLRARQASLADLRRGDAD